MRKKRAPWPRRAKVARNLLLVLLLGVFIWGLLGKPLPHEAALRRLERQYLIPETEHSTEIPRGYRGGNVRVDWNEYAAMASIRVLRAASPRSYYYYYPITEIYRLTEGPNLLALPWSALFPGDTVGTIDIYAVYAVVDPPEDSVTADLTLHKDGKTVTASSRKEDGVYVFYIPPEPDDEQGNVWLGPDGRFSGQSERFSCELVFYGGDGEVLDIVRSSDGKGAAP